MDKIIIKKNTISELYGIDKSYLSSINEDELDLLAEKINTNELDRYVLLKPLILESESLNNNDKLSWLDLLPNMTYEQIRKLLDILINETKRLNEIESVYAEKRRNIREKFLNRWKKMGYIENENIFEDKNA